MPSISLIDAGETDHEMTKGVALSHLRICRASINKAYRPHGRQLAFILLFSREQGKIQRIAADRSNHHRKLADESCVRTHLLKLGEIPIM